MEIVKEWELGKVSVLDEKVEPVIDFLMNKLSLPFESFLLSYCYNKMKILVEIYDRMKLMQFKEPIKILAENSVFSKKEILGFTEKWDAIEEAKMKMLEEIQRDIKKFQRKKIQHS